MTVAERASGVCKWFSDDKGFGFLIIPGHDKDVFVHRQQLLRSGLEKLTEGDKVTCLVQEGKKGMFATSISKVS